MLCSSSLQSRGLHFGELRIGVCMVVSALAARLPFWLCCRTGTANHDEAVRRYLDSLVAENSFYDSSAAHLQGFYPPSLWVKNKQLESRSISFFIASPAPAVGVEGRAERSTTWKERHAWSVSDEAEWIIKLVSQIPKCYQKLLKLL